MRKNIFRICIMICLCSLFGLAGCKKQQATAGKEDITTTVDAQDEVIFVLRGNHMINVDITSDSIKDIYYENESNVESARYGLEMELYKADKLSAVIKINKDGYSFTSMEESDTDEKLEFSSGSVDTEKFYWLSSATNVSVRLCSPGLCDYFSEYENYSMYSCDYSSDSRVAICENISISENTQRGSTSGVYAMKFDIEYVSEDEVSLFLVNHSFGTVEDEYIIYMYREEDTLDRPSAYLKYYNYTFDFGEVIYDSEGNPENKLLLTQKRIVDGSFVEFKADLKYDGIEAMFKEYTLFMGYMGEDFKDLVYVVVK